METANSLKHLSMETAKNKKEKEEQREREKRDGKRGQVPSCLLNPTRDGVRGELTAVSFVTIKVGVPMSGPLTLVSMIRGVDSMTSPYEIDTTDTVVNEVERWNLSGFTRSNLLHSTKNEFQSWHFLFLNGDNFKSIQLCELINRYHSLVKCALNYITFQRSPFYVSILSAHNFNFTRDGSHIYRVLDESSSRGSNQK